MADQYDDGEAGQGYGVGGTGLAASNAEVRLEGLDEQAVRVDASENTAQEHTSRQ